MAVNEEDEVVAPSTVSVILVRRKGFDLAWAILKVWRAQYGLLRKHNGFWQSLYIGYRVSTAGIEPKWRVK